MGHWNGLSIELENRLNSGMFDGRLIHFHLQFIEPLLLRHNRAATASATERPDFSISMDPRADAISAWEDLRVAGVPGQSDLSLVRPSEDVPFPMLLTNSDEGVWPTEALAAALAEIAAADLTFMLQLGTGLFAVDVDQAWLGSIPFVSPVSQSQPAHDLAERMVENAAGHLARNWVIEEWRLATGEVGPASQVDRNLLPALFAEFVRVEYLLRLEGRRKKLAPGQREWLDHALSRARSRAPHFLIELNTIPGSPLTKELICIWFPSWRRSAFIYDSPFDHIKDLPLDGAFNADVEDFLEFDARDIRGSLHGP